MKTKRIMTDVTAKRCRTADRKGKSRILDEFVKTAGCNRNYALHILANRGKTALVRLAGPAANLRAGNERGSKKRRPGGRPKTYTEDVAAAMRVIRAVYDWMCPPVNFWYPSVKVVAKERLPSGRYKKIYGRAKTPCQRLSESSGLSDTVKDELRRGGPPLSIRLDWCGLNLRH
jgi:hypothetical protein